MANVQSPIAYVASVDDGKGAVRVFGLDDEARRYLIDARQWLDSGGPFGALLTNVQAGASVAAAESHRRPGDLGGIRKLAIANARAVAAASAGIPLYPDQVGPHGVIGVANLQVCQGRNHVLCGRADVGLDHFMAALENEKIARATVGTSAFDATILATASRAASTAGEIAAIRMLSVAALLDRVDTNIVRPYADILTTVSLDSVRGLAGVSMLRAALNAEDLVYLGALRLEFVSRGASLIPKDPATARRFNSDAQAILDEIAVRLGGQRRGKFEW